MLVHLQGGPKTETGKFLLHFQNSKVCLGGSKNASPFMGGVQKLKLANICYIFKTQSPFRGV